MVGVNPGVVLHDAHVGDQAAGKHLHATLVSHYSFRNCTHPWLNYCKNVTKMTFIHTHTVHPKLSQHLKFCYSFIVRTTHHGIHTLPHYTIKVEGSGNLKLVFKNLRLSCLVVDTCLAMSLYFLLYKSLVGKNLGPNFSSFGPFRGCWQANPGRLMWSFRTIMSPTWISEALVWKGINSKNTVNMLLRPPPAFVTIRFSTPINFITLTGMAV